MGKRVLGLFLLGLALGSGVGAVGVDFLRPGLWAGPSTVPDDGCNPSPGASPGALILPSGSLACPPASACPFPSAPQARSEGSPPGVLPEPSAQRLGLRGYPA